jgi:hypothetical protein
MAGRHPSTANASRCSNVFLSYVQASSAMQCIKGACVFSFLVNILTCWSYTQLTYELLYVGRAIAQEVSRRLPTATARVRAQDRSCEICGGQSGTGTGFLRVLRFPLPILIPPTAPRWSSIVRDPLNRAIIGWLTTWTQSHPTQRN